MIYRAVNASINRSSGVKFSSLRFTGNKLKRTSRLSCGDKDVYTGTEFCTGTTLYRKYHDGICGTYDSVQATNSATCGYVAPPPPPPPGPPPPPSGCTAGYEGVNDACAYCNVGTPACRIGYSCFPILCYLQSNCVRINCNCNSIAPGGYVPFNNPGCP